MKKTFLFFFSFFKECNCVNNVPIQHHFSGSKKNNLFYFGVKCDLIHSLTYYILQKKKKTMVLF